MGRLVSPIPRLDRQDFKRIKIGEPFEGVVLYANRLITDRVVLLGYESKHSIEKIRRCKTLLYVGWPPLGHPEKVISLQQQTKDLERVEGLLSLLIKIGFLSKEERDLHLKAVVREDRKAKASNFVANFLEGMDQIENREKLQEEFEGLSEYLTSPFDFHREKGCRLAMLLEIVKQWI